MGTTEADPLFDDPEQFVLAGSTMLAPPAAARLLHAAVHRFISTSIRQGTMRDFTEIRNVGSDELAYLAAHFRCTAIVQRVFADLDPAHEVLASALTPTRLERVLGHESATGSYCENLVWREFTGLVLTPGLRQRAGYARSRILLDKEFRTQRRVNWKTYVRMAMRPITSRRVRREVPD